MMRRTTVSADRDDLATLEYEAKRRGVSLTHILREAVAEYAAGVRTARKPSFGIGRGGPDLAQASVDDEEAPYRTEPSDRDE
jgi:ribbon-helix-helix CopG family protein